MFALKSYKHLILIDRNAIYNMLHIVFSRAINHDCNYIDKELVEPVRLNHITCFYVVSPVF